MSKGWRLGGTYKYNGDKVIVSAINDDGTLVLNYAAGSGKTGFAGKIASGFNDKQPIALLPEGFLVDGDDVEEVDGVSLDSYMNYTEVDENTSIPELLDNMVMLSNKLVDSWQNTIDNFEKTHAESTARLADISGLTVDEYELWLDNPERTTEPTWVGLEFDENDKVMNARVVSDRGNLITVQSNGYETMLTRYIGKRYMNSKLVKDVYTEEDLDSLDSIFKEIDY